MKLRYVTAVAVSALAIAAGVPALSCAQEGVSQEGEAEKSAESLLEQDVMIRKMARAQRDAHDAAQAAHKAAQATQMKLRSFFTVPDGLPRHLTAIQQAAEKYRDASDEAAKNKAKEKLVALIEKYFEEDMVVRQRELADIEARLVKLRTQLDRRRAKKDDIVDLQCQVAINEAEGLGFTSPPKDNLFNLRIEAPSFVAPVGDALGAPVPVAPPPPPQPVKAWVTLDRPTLEQGAEGELVIALQSALNERIEPSPEIQVDGDFGPETKSAVEQFQSQKGLEPTGVVDAATWKALGPLEQLGKPVPTELIQ